MQKVLKGIISIIAGLVSILLILLIALVVWATHLNEINIWGIIFIIVSAIVLFLTGWFCIRSIMDLINPERIKQRKEAKEEQRLIKQRENDKRQIEMEKKQEEFFAQERMRRDEEYRLLREADSIIEKKQSEKELEYRKKEQELADDDIARILRPSEGGPVYLCMILSRVLVGMFLLGTLALIINNSQWIQKHLRVQVAVFCIIWYVVLVLLFVSSAVFRGIYRSQLLQVLVKTTKERYYFAMVQPRYENASQSFGKIKRMMDNSEIIEGNRKLHQAAREYMESEEFSNVLSDCIHRKTVDTAERMTFIYLQDYRVKKGVIQNTICYTDEKTNRKSKINVSKRIELV